MQNADHPIQSHHDDKLNRALFSQYIARCMLDHTETENLVVGLSGGWGSGKTSMINMIKEELNFAKNNAFDEEKPIVLMFNPWNYSDQHQMLYHFFKRVAFTLRECEYLEGRETIVSLIETYTAFFTDKGGIGDDIAEIKDQLNVALAATSHKLIIIIDNIGRLNDPEIKQIFQIVKCLADFSNTVYLLSYDKQVITKALDRLQPGQGQEYLEKIIQVPFEISPIGGHALESLLLKHLNAIMQNDISDDWEPQHWENLYHSGLKHLFENMRDLSRFVNVFSFSYDRIKQVINPIDFIAICALQVFAPEIYANIRDNKDLFTDLMEAVYVEATDRQQQEQLRCDAILALARKMSVDVMRRFLTYLFPYLNTIYNTKPVVKHDPAVARKNKRICSADHFDAYFRLSLPTYTMSSLEADLILRSVEDATAFEQALRRLNKDDRILQFFDYLEDEKTLSTVPEAAIHTIIAVLFNTADYFPDEQSGTINFRMPTRIHRICIQLLKRLPDAQARFEAYHTAIKATDKSLSTFIDELTLLRATLFTHPESGSPRSWIVTPINFLSLKHLVELEKLAKTKIKLWADKDQLLDHPKLATILYAWKAWDSQGHFEIFMKDVLADDNASLSKRGLVRMMASLLRDDVNHMLSERRTREDWAIEISKVERLVPRQILEPYARSLFEDTDFKILREKEQLAITIYLDAIGSEAARISE